MSVVKEKVKSAEPVTINEAPKEPKKKRGRPAKAKVGAVTVAEVVSEAIEVTHQVPKTTNVTYMLDLGQNPTTDEKKAVTRFYHGQYQLKFKSGNLLDPFVISGSPERSAADYEFMTVDQSAYNSYLMYLGNKNPARFRMADAQSRKPI